MRIFCTASLNAASNPLSLRRAQTAPLETSRGAFFVAAQFAKGPLAKGAGILLCKMTGGFWQCVAERSCQCLRRPDFSHAREIGERVRLETKVSKDFLWCETGCAEKTSRRCGKLYCLCVYTAFGFVRTVFQCSGSTDERLRRRGFGCAGCSTDGNVRQRVRSCRTFVLPLRRY